MNEANFNEIYQKYNSEITAYISYRLFNKSKCVKFDADELTNDVFLKVHRNINRFDVNKSSLRTWLYNITNNAIIDWQRMYIKKQMLSADSFEHGYLETPENSNKLNLIDKTLINESIFNFINDLNKSYKDIAYQYFMMNKSINEISEELNLPIGTVKNYIFQIRAKASKNKSLKYVYENLIEN